MLYHATYKLINSITEEVSFNLIGITADHVEDARENLEKIIPTLKTSFNYDRYEITEIKEERDV